MIAVAITGASGPILGIRLAEELLKAGRPVHAVVSGAAWAVIGHELGLKKRGPGPFRALLAARGLEFRPSLLAESADGDFFSPLASGSTPLDALVVAPCSMKTLSAAANGYSDSLITRACDVALKERKRLVLVARETPLSAIHLENMLKLSRAGAVVLPPAMAFYARPKTLSDMTDFVVGKVLNVLGVEHALFKSWDKQSGELKRRRKK